MAAPKVMSGARAIVNILDKNTGLPKAVGIFNSFSYGVTYDVQPAYILGRFSAAALDYTAVEPVNITAGGWRVIGHGPHTEGLLPNLKDLLTTEQITLIVVDRATNKKVASISGCRPTGYSTAVSARQLQEMTNTYMGLLVDDEDTINEEAAGSNELP